MDKPKYKCRSLSIYGDRMSLNSYDSANYSYASGGVTSNNEGGSIGGNINAVSSTAFSDECDNEELRSLPIQSTASLLTRNQDCDSAIDNTPSLSHLSVSSHVKSNHKRYVSKRFYTGPK